MPELKDSLGLPVRYISPHDGRSHAAIVIKIRHDDTVNLVHFDPESGLQQMRLAVPYSFALVANTFHWTDDDNQPKTDEERAAAQLNTVTSVQTTTGLPPSASVWATDVPSPSQSQSDAPYVPKGSFELQQSDKPGVRPQREAVPAESPEASQAPPPPTPEGPREPPQEPTLPPQPEPHPVEVAETPTPLEESETEAWERDPEVTDQDPFARARREEKGEAD